MSRELPIPRQDDRSDGTAVIEWGEVESGAPERRHPLAALGRDGLLPPLLAGLGAVAGVGSLFGEWVVMTLPDSGRDDQPLEVPAGVAEIGGLGIGYLVGLLALVCTVALALRGTPGVRLNARVAGFALAGSLLAVLAVAAVQLDDPVRRGILYSPQDGFRIEYGRGLVMAFVACALLGAALRLAPYAAVPDGTETSGPVLPRRRRTAREEPDDVPPAPADLTVQPTVPFARPEPPI
ncbi:hypothetical protein [Micromonospora globbae]|uniref:hypothetical protein n=1 Tax=Micromonospora globbae TaxID=1894969 RepID=UPI00379D2B9E